jgi:uncharacterized protein YecT (DUF1311 family)
MKIAHVFAVSLLTALTAFATANATLETARQHFQAADVLLNKTYKTVCAGLTKAQVSALRDLQRDWLKYREQKAQDLMRFNGDVPLDAANDVSEANPAYWKYMTSLTQDRIEFLNVYTGTSVPKGISGEYKDFYDGDLTLKEAKNGIRFSCVVARGPAEHEGDTSGVAQLHGDKAIYKEVVPPGEDRKPAQLTFTFIAGHVLKVESLDTDYYQGTGAYFDGLYYKTKE